MLAILLSPILLLAAACISTAVYTRSKDTATQRALKSFRRVEIGAIVDGDMVKVSGRLAYAQVPLVAPLSGRRCAAWEVVVEMIVPRGGEGHWKEVISEQESQDFYLVDETGRALVRARSPMMALHPDVWFSSGAEGDATSRLEAFLESRGLSSTNALGANYEIMYREGVLEEGELVAVLGTARVEPDPDCTAKSYREVATRVVVDEPDEDPLMLSDTASTTR